VNEHLTFNHGVAVGLGLSQGVAGPRSTAPAIPARPVEWSAAAMRPIAAKPFTLPVVRADAAYWGAWLFTALLFFRPQDTFPVLDPLHLPEITAIAALLAMGASRLAAGQPIVKITPEIGGVLGLAIVMLVTTPFSVWPGGAFSAFLEVYLKVALIFILLTHTVRSPEMLKRLTWLLILAMGYVALRGVMDYLRGVNLIAGGRLAGPIAGLMGNPNDLAMNMVTFIPFAIVAALGRGQPAARLVAAAIAVLMAATIVFTKSRAGLLGLAVMGIVLIVQGGRLRAGLLMAVLVGALVAIPTMPEAMWTRISSIVNQEEDETGSREARKELMLQGWRTFLDRPLTGVGVGQFQNYNPPGRSVMWQETHNVILQVLAELGAAGGAIFVFLLIRPVISIVRTRRLLPRAPSRRIVPENRTASLAFRPSEAEWLRAHTAAAMAGFAGWFACAQFASIGYYWTFYYLLALIVAAREVAVSRTELVRRAAVSGHQPATAGPPA
jgi:putative inorganic carbon (hco3(-)) transporter